MTSSKNIGHNIELFLKRENMSTTELAERLGVSRSSINYWINGSRIPKTDKLRAMASIFGCAMYDFMIDPNDEISPHQKSSPQELDDLDKFLSDPDTSSFEQAVRFLTKNRNLVELCCLIGDNKELANIVIKLAKAVIV